MRLATLLPGISVNKLNSCLRSGNPHAVLARDQEVIVDRQISVAPTIYVEDVKIEGVPRDGELPALVNFLKTWRSNHP